MNYVKKYLSLSIVFVLMLSLLPTPALANSAQTMWDGTDSTGAIINGEDCPIVVEHELLTFAIHEFPESYYREVGDYLAYSGSVTAEYSFYNPADYDVTATLVFPFGGIPDYGDIWDNEKEKPLRYSDTEKYDITVDGTPIERKLRHTFMFWGHQFALDEDMAKLHDGFMDDPFYSPDMPVTRYTYMPSDVDTKPNQSANAAFVLSSDPSKTRVYMEGGNGGQASEDAVQLEGWVDPAKPFVVNVIGEPLTEMPDWKFYTNGSCEEETEGTMTLVSEETVTLKEFLLQEYDPASGVLDYDWYNAMVTALNYFEWAHGAIASTEIGFDISDRLMRWYEYEINIGAGERVVNRVTAPIYPAINSRYVPPIYEYTYLLSPAQTWTEFGTLDIVVNTPFYMIEDGVTVAFEQTDTGYAAHLDGLPEGELTFTLCSESVPKIPAFQGGFPMDLLLIGAIMLVMVVVVIIVTRSAKKKTH